MLNNVLQTSMDYKPQLHHRFDTSFILYFNAPSTESPEERTFSNLLEQIYLLYSCYYIYIHVNYNIMPHNRWKFISGGFGLACV